MTKLTEADIRTESFKGGWLGLGLARSRIPHTEHVKPTSAIYLSAVTVNLLGLVLPLSMLQVYDRIIPNVAEVTLGALVLVLVIAVGLEAVLRISRLQIDHFNASKFSHNVTVDAFGRLLNPHGQTSAKLSPRKTIDRLESIARLGGYLGGPARQVVVDLPFSAVFFLTIGIVGGWLVLIPIAIAAIFAMITVMHGRALERTVDSKDANNARIFDFITEVLSGISTVKGLSIERMMMRRFEHLGGASAVDTFNHIVASDRAMIMAGSLGNLTTVAVATSGATMVVNGSITIGTLAACSLLAGRAVQPALRVAGIWNEYQRTKLALREASKVFAMATLDSLDTTTKCERAPEIRLLDVHHEMGPGRPAFQKIDLSIAPNDIASFCGPDGTGKSTLLRLIAGLQEPTSGHVLVGGMNARTFRSCYRNSVGLVSAESEVFQGSIIDNLVLFGAGCSQETALRTCQILGLEDEIYRFPDGYATELGVGAAETLPKSFIQRIVLARAFAQQPRLLIVDEAQGFLDFASASKLREALKDAQIQSTIILAGNQSDYLEISNRIFDVSKIGTEVTVMERANNSGILL